MSNTDAAGDWNAASGASGEGATSPKDLASNAAQAVKQEAQSFAAQAKEKASGQIEQHKETATRALGDFANAIRKAGDELSQTDQSVASRLVQQAADGLENLSRSVTDKRPEELIDAVRDFGRRNPTAFVAGAVLVGLAVGRFLKSSGESRTQQMPTTFQSPYGGAPDVGFYDEGTSEVTDAGATSIGAPAAEFGGGDAGVEGLTGSVSQDPTMAGPDSADLDLDDAGAQDGDDRDRARFGGTGV